MNGKFFVFSRTLVGIVVASLPVLLSSLDIEFGEEEQRMISGFWDSIITTVGLAIAIWGRFIAKGPLTLTPNTDETLQA